ncbi:hypothetical protein Hdeb2414_s0001g00013901 [Helianthus debilis subsp. tardiflorus]
MFLFIFILKIIVNYKFCPLCLHQIVGSVIFFQKFTGGVLNLSKSCTLCPLGQTQLDFSVKSGHMHCT